MKKIPVAAWIAAIVVALLVGGIGGFGLGVLSTRVGSDFINDCLEQEAYAETKAPMKIDREAFELEYPSNWKIDTASDIYDPDGMFKIESPGSAFVMFAFSKSELSPEDCLESQVKSLSEALQSPTRSEFKTYGNLSGNGVILKGKCLGIKFAVKIFVYTSNGRGVIVVTHYPDEDFKYVENGLKLIEDSLILKNNSEQDAQEETDPVESQ